MGRQADTFRETRDYVRKATPLRIVVALLLGGYIGVTLAPWIGCVVVCISLAGMLFERAVYMRHAENADDDSVRRLLALATAGTAISFGLPTFLIMSAITLAAGYVAATYACSALIFQTIGYSRNRSLTLFATLPHGVGLLGAGTMLGLHHVANGQALVGITILLIAPVFCLMILYLFHEISTRDAKLRKALSQARARSREAEANRLRAEAANIAKTNFLASMSHELRTPMNGILGLADMLGRTSPDPTARRYGEIIQSSADSLMVILNDVLDFSKLEAGRIDLDPEPFELRGMMESVASLTQARIDPDAVELGVEVGDDVPGMLLGDETRLRQILLNLAGNAAKFTAQGRITLAVQCLVASDASGRVGLRLSVTDTGIGIAQNGIERMFERFSQASAGTTREYGGTGLGLSICRELAGLMDAHIGAVSEPGVGSCFYLDIALPVVPAAEARGVSDGTEHVLESARLAG